LHEKYTNKLEPWDLTHLTDYNDSYLAGFRTEVYQIDLKSGFEKAKSMMEQPIRSSICRDIGGDHQRIEGHTTEYIDTTFKHILLPIWLSAYRYNGKVYHFMINGRTGAVKGERPYSWRKITLVVLLIVAIMGLFVILSKQ
jgi:hypothetical protein